MKHRISILFNLIFIAALTACVNLENLPAPEEAAMEATPVPQEEAASTAAMNTSDLIDNYDVPGFPAFAKANTLMEIVSRDDDTIRVKHAYGETDIPADPQRIYVHDLALMQILLSLDIEPIGAASFLEALPVALQGKADNVELLLDFGEGVNLEQLAALNPDLILAHAQPAPGMIDDEQYEAFSQIAPTVAFTGIPFFFWKEATIELGDFFGVPEKAEAVLTDYNAQVADYRAQAQGILGDESVTILLLFDTTMWLYSVGGPTAEEYLPLSVTTWAYRDLRLTPAPEVSKLAGADYWAEVSLELIPEITADHLIVFPNAYGGEEIGSGLDDYLDSPLWQTVPAVKDDKVYQMTTTNSIEGYWTTLHLIETFLDVLEE
ncbi:MAG: ABC transporter substrate-binding protein [Chloroflexota bacterium]